MKYCYNCGNQIDDNAQFCQNCGAPQSNTVIPPQMNQQYPTNIPYNNQGGYSQPTNNGTPQNRVLPQPYYGSYQQPYGNSQYEQTQNPNNNFSQQQSFNIPEYVQLSGKKAKKKEKSKNTSCMTIGLWILCFPIMLWIYAIKKKQPVWYVIAAAVSFIFLVLIIISPKENKNTQKVSVATPMVQSIISNDSNVSYDTVGNNLDAIDEINVNSDNTAAYNDGINIMLTSIAKDQKPSSTPKPTQTPKPTKTPTMTPTAITYTPVTVQTLVNDLNGNAARAKQLYEGNYFEITGYVANIDASAKYITLDPSNGEWDFNLTNVQIFVKNDDQKQYVLSLTKGQYVVILAKCTKVGEILGYSFDWQ